MTPGHFQIFSTVTLQFLRCIWSFFFYNIFLHRQQKGFSLGDAPQPKNGHPHLTADSLGFLIAVPTDRINCLGQGG